jgi:lipoprotein NlpI
MKKVILTALLMAAGTAPVHAGGYTFLNIGINLLNQDRYADSVPWFDKALAAGDLLPDQIHVARLDRGMARVETGDYAKAAEDFTAALALRPDATPTLMLLAYAHIGAGENDKAIAEIAQLKKKGTAGYRMRYDSGLLEWALERYNEAGEDFKAAADDGYSYAWLWQQMVNLKLGRPVTSYRGMSAAIPGEHRRVKIQTGWPETVVDFYLGTATEQDVFDAVGEAAAQTGRACEANFYVAEWRELHGDAAGARPLLQKAAQDCPSEYEEKRMSTLELKKLP